MNVKKDGGRVLKWIERHPVPFFIIIATVLEIALELLGRRSFGDFLSYHIYNMVFVICNILIITVSLSVSLLFKRRLFMVIITVSLWIALGIANSFMLAFRSTPLNISDFYMLRFSAKMMILYVTPVQAALIFSAIAAAGFLGYIVWRRIPKQRRAAVKAVPVLFSAMVFIVITSSVSVSAGNYNENSEYSVYDPLYDTYAENGFAFSLSMSLFERGMPRPEKYGGETVTKIVDTIEQTSAPDGEMPVYPDIIMVQLESFFDVNRLAGIDYTENPVPVWSGLRKNYISGYLTVPVIGAGTAKTEFEILTAMKIKYFEMGENPYNTVLCDNFCESIASILSENGYSTAAFHNNTGAFYDRDKVFPNLGFDSYTALEDMSEVEYNVLGWAKDDILIDEMMSSLTDGRDFLFTVTVQAHGRYPDALTEDAEQYASLESQGLSDEYNEKGGLSSVENAFNYYINELREVDAFIGRLISEVEKSGSPTVIVFYGDHLPRLNYDCFSLAEGEINMTEYVIWDNIGLDKNKENIDMFTYQLSPYVLNKLGIAANPIFELHSEMRNSPSYEEMLYMLEYDLLYGQKYSQR